ncbi:glycoside hydrolase family 38 C-terminal domain-containing protein [Devosia algicola]|uniref:Glycoside hydrolase family 38 C-terminal domain-containing protein n=1 Tax=Devosia algicola TaxID=3026418 RepID=A0ABY7YSA8_9HYPH|nr:glycoside hydrolase family 38 C-terminal domain-containing protein [Devosia algicola]WDR04223.1 glycoside hydrolase family 38 C-terminal domain-containing protein [Devosia algicola]
MTSVAKNKAYNRTAERRLRETEFLAAFALVTTGADYPGAALATFWETVLINQFHDILPGTSISEVYSDSDREYEDLFAQLDSANGQWFGAAVALAKPTADQFGLFNFVAQERSAQVLLGDDQSLVGTTLVTAGGSVPVQEFVRADGSAAFGAVTANLPSMGWTSAQIVTITPPKLKSALSVSKKHLENDLVRVEFDRNGEITSIFDKQRGREVIPSGQMANRLIAFEDKPMAWDAWDIDRYFEEQYWPLADAKATISVVEKGPHRVAIRIERHYQASRITQIISLQTGAREIEFDTHIDWHEQRTVLKACFPFDLNRLRGSIRNPVWPRQARHPSQYELGQGPI